MTLSEGNDGRLLSACIDRGTHKKGQRDTTSDHGQIQDVPIGGLWDPR